MNRHLARTTPVLVGVSLALAAVPSLAAPRTFKLTTGEVRFEIDAPLDTIIGVSRGLGGAVEVDPAEWGRAAAGRISVDLGSFKTGIDLRDEDLRVQFFEHPTFASATLSIAGLERPSAPKLLPAESAEAVLVGKLALHGVERDVRIPIKVKYDDNDSGSRVRVSGSFDVPLEQFAMKRPRRLLFKLGGTVRVQLSATFRAPPATAPADTAPTAAAVAEDALPPTSPVVVARPPKKPPAPKWAFPANTTEGRGERLMGDPTLGGPNNQITCRSCHSVQDERKGIFVGGTVKPSSTLYGTAKRPSLWQGFAKTPGAAASLCAKMFMLRPQGLTEEQERVIDAALAALSPDPAAARDYTVIHRSRTQLPKSLEDPAAGDINNGKKLTEVYCASCHKAGSVRPALEPGLYERKMIGERVRHVNGSDANQMPPIPLDRLSDSELVDIAAYLADEKLRIFNRTKPKATAP